MANDSNTSSKTAAPFDMDAFAAALVKATSANQINGAELGAAIAQGVEAAQPKKDVEFGEWISRPENREPDLARPVFQNGSPIQIKGCSQDTIDHLNALQPGKYLGGAITVTVRGDEPNQQVHITYPCARLSERMKIYQLVTSFSDMVQKIHQEAQAAKVAVAR